MIELTEKKLKVISWVFLGASVAANIIVPYAAQFYVDYYDKLLNFQAAMHNVGMAFTEDGGMNFALNGHFTIFGTAAFVFLRNVSLSARLGPATAYCRYTGFMTSGVLMVFISYWFQCDLLTSKESLTGVGYFFLPPAALISAFPTFFMGWLWGLWRIPKRD